MVKVVRPLFSDSARGNIADIGSFRMAPSGPQFIAMASPSDPKTAPQLQSRDCFRRAKAEHTALGDGNRPPWPDFWRTWLADHPECMP